MTRKAVAALALLGLLIPAAGSAGAQQQQQPSETRSDRSGQDAAGPLTNSRELQGSDAQHGQAGEHLPASRENMRLINRVKLTDIAGGIADVNYRAGHAYLSKWATTCTNAGGTGAGIEVVDVRKPRQARRVAFIKAGPNAYQTEGVHALKLKTRKFEGNVVVFSNEPCDGTQPGGGGFSIYDVSNPRRPKMLVDQFGDTDVLGEGSPNAYHSVFAWNDGNRAFAVAVDNFEFEDVDIFNITDPRNPRFIRETGADEWPESVFDNLAHGGIAGVFLHDVWVKKVDGMWQMLLSYWDLGYVLLNVNDPKNPVFMGKTQWDEFDPLMPEFSPPEGNAHHATWSKNNRFIVATDEDFAPHRVRTVTFTTGPNTGDYPAAAVGGLQAPNQLPDGVLNGPTVYGGYGCPPDVYPGATPVPQRDDFAFTLEAGEEAILVLQRGPRLDPSEPETDPPGGCFPGEKAFEATKAGWDAVLFVNRHLGDPAADLPFCGSGGAPPGAPPAVGVCTTHEAFHLLFETTPSFESPYENLDEPAIGDLGAEISTTGEFDGWGYIHLFDADTLERLDSYAVPESLDPDLAHIFPLSVHETKTDPRRGKNIAYSSYYLAGARVLKFSRQKGLREVGHFIDEGGNDFWGVYPVKRGTKRPLLLFSDRDYGLYILKYTGNQ